MTTNATTTTTMTVRISAKDNGNPDRRRALKLTF
jgi:hypothetical protein